MLRDMLEVGAEAGTGGGAAVSHRALALVSRIEAAVAAIGQDMPGW